MASGPRQIGNPLPVLADIRKGAPKQEYVDGQTGQARSTVGKDLEWFRFAKFDADDADLSAFIESFGPEPNDLQFVFPFPDVEENFTFFNEAYRNKLMVHRCTTTDGLILSEINPTNFAKVIKQGLSIDTGEPVYCQCPDQPLYLDNKGRPVYCSPVVRMKIMLPGQGRVGVFQVLSSSAYDGIRLSAQLAMFKEVL